MTVDCIRYSSRPQMMQPGEGCPRSCAAEKASVLLAASFRIVYALAYIERLLLFLNHPQQVLQRLSHCLFLIRNCTPIPGKPLHKGRYTYHHAPMHLNTVHTRSIPHSISAQHRCVPWCAAARQRHPGAQPPCERPERWT